MHSSAWMFRSVTGTVGARVWDSLGQRPFSNVLVLHLHMTDGQALMPPPRQGSLDRPVEAGGETFSPSQPFPRGFLSSHPYPTFINRVCCLGEEAASPRTDTPHWTDLPPGEGPS